MDGLAKHFYQLIFSLMTATDLRANETLSADGSGQHLSGVSWLYRIDFALKLKRFTTLKSLLKQSFEGRRYLKQFSYNRF